MRCSHAVCSAWVPAMVPWRASEDGMVTPEVLEWYGRFAEGRPGVIVVEATGIFATREACQKHIDAGAKRVVLTVPPKDEIDAMVVLGVVSLYYSLNLISLMILVGLIVLVLSIGSLAGSMRSGPEREG